MSMENNFENDDELTFVRSCRCPSIDYEPVANFYMLFKTSKVHHDMNNYMFFNEAEKGAVLGYLCLQIQLIL